MAASRLAPILAPSAGPPLIQLNVTASPQRGAAPLAVSFVGSANGSSTASSITFNWQFGDGSSAYIETITVSNGSRAVSNVQHVYDKNGSYSLLLKVSDNVGDGARSATVPIVATNPLEVTVSVSAVNITAGRPLTFTASVTGGLAPYFLTWYNATHVHPSGCTQSGLTFTCTPAQPKTSLTNLTMIVQVADSANNVATAQVGFTVYQKLAGVLGFTTQYVCSGSSGEVYGSYSAQLTHGTAGYTYVWDFGDGSANSSTPNGSHLFPAGGPYTVHFVGTDSSGSVVAQSYNVSTSYPACAQVAAPSYTPPVLFLEVASGVLVAIIVGLAVVLARGLLATRPPSSPKPPVSGWKGPEGSSPTATRTPPPGAT